MFLLCFFPMRIAFVPFVIAVFFLFPSLAFCSVSEVFFYSVQFHCICSALFLLYFSLFISHRCDDIKYIWFIQNSNSLFISVNSWQLILFFYPFHAIPIHSDESLFSKTISHFVCTQKARVWNEQSPCSWIEHRKKPKKMYAQRTRLFSVTIKHNNKFPLNLPIIRHVDFNKRKTRQNVEQNKNAKQRKKVEITTKANRRRFIVNISDQCRQTPKCTLRSSFFLFFKNWYQIPRNRKNLKTITYWSAWKKGGKS